MIIAEQHIKGTAKHKLSTLLGCDTEYTPTCAWPDDCKVQWGHGIIPATPFFEAFPPGTFIRGEGSTIAEAEQQAFAQFQGERTCDHQWGRQRPGGTLYTNGAGWCRKCHAFRGKMFKSIVELGHMRKPLSRSEQDWLRSLEDEEMNERMNRKHPEMIEDRKRNRRQLQIRLHLYGVKPEGGPYL